MRLLDQRADDLFFLRQLDVDQIGCLPQEQRRIQAGIFRRRYASLSALFRGAERDEQRASHTLAKKICRRADRVDPAFIKAVQPPFEHIRLLRRHFRVKA